MRCLKRFVAREVYQTITNPPSDVPTGAQIRILRTALGINMTDSGLAVGTTYDAISRLERGIIHDTNLARRTRDWLLTITP